MEANAVEGVCHFMLRPDWSGRTDMSDLKGHCWVFVFVIVKLRAEVERGRSAMALRR